MPKYTVRIVIFPRYTTMIGATPLYSSPMDVRAYAEAIFVAWQGTGLGGTPATVTYTIQQSPDLETWVDLDTLSPSAGTEETQGVVFSYPWIRVKAVVSGSDPGVAGWLVGDFVRRDAPGAAA